MALFGKKKDKDEAAQPEAAAGADSGAQSANGSPGDGSAYNPENAAKFFAHARSMHETTNYEYAMTLWLNGLRQDPTSMDAMESFFRSAHAFLASGKKQPSKDSVKQFAGARTPLERFLLALLQWGVRPSDAVSAVRAMEAAVKLDLPEQAYWIGERATNVAASDKKPSKSLLVKLVNLFAQIQAYDKAVEIGQAAVRLDPSDGKLATEIRNMSAQAALSRGGYDQTGESGGFRANIRDAARQKALEAQDRIVKTEETIDALLKAAREDWESRPQDPAAIRIYAKRLLERGTPEDEKTAFNLLKKAFEETGQFQFRQQAGEIALRHARRNLSRYRQEAEEKPGDAEAQSKYQAALKDFQELELKEYRARVEAYPTDLGLKYELGKRYFNMGQHEQAIAMLQEAQGDPKHRIACLNMLAQAFLAIDWIDESIGTFRDALTAHRVPEDDLGMELRYGLLCALEAKGEQEDDLGAAEEAYKLASSIAIQNIAFRDIRARRDSIKQLLMRLRKSD
ncbi:MAG: hypothetical protein ACF8R7_14270 [Phycisphaerales bacterium JB039]